MQRTTAVVFREREGQREKEQKLDKRSTDWKSKIVSHKQHDRINSHNNNKLEIMKQKQKHVNYNENNN